MTTSSSSPDPTSADQLYDSTGTGAHPTARFTATGPVWSLRTLAAASVLSVALAAGGGAALAAVSDSSGSTQPGRGTGPGGFTPFPGGPGTSPGQSPTPQLPLSTGAHRDEGRDT